MVTRRTPSRSPASAIYVGGHQRWWNNPASADNAGPGSVERTGIGALDPVNGLPLAWNPGRERGQGVFDMLATTEGLFIGSDTDRVNGEFHGRLAFFPLAVDGQGEVPQPQAPDLPVNAYTLGSLPSDNGSVIARVNAGGPAIPSIDGGPDWQADNAASNPLHNTGNTTKSWGAVGSVNASVPAGTPSAVFSSERIDQLLGNEMQWNIPAPTGTNIGVRLYFANQCTCTNTTGKLRFHVDVDGVRKLSNYDIVADAGNQIGTMKQFNVVSRRQRRHRLPEHQHPAEPDDQRDRDHQPRRRAQPRLQRRGASRLHRLERVRAGRRCPPGSSGRSPAARCCSTATSTPRGPTATSTSGPSTAPRSVPRRT